MSALARLEALQAEFGGGAAARKVALLRELDRARLASARAVERLHEALCFLRAYPDGPDVLAQVERMLGGFAERGDLRRHRTALADSGIAGTEIRYPFFAETAFWLRRRCPGRLRIAWDAFAKEELLAERLPLLALYAETPGLDEEPFTAREWIARMKGPGETDADFLLARFEKLGGDTFLRQTLWDETGVELVLAPGPGTPSRTAARAPGLVPFFRRGPLRRERPDLRRVLRRKPRGVRAVSPARGRALIDLAREAMVTRGRDLDVFMHGDPRDVRLVEWEDGLCFAVIGFKPERRLLLEAVYGFLTLQGGVPIGYVLNSALFGSAEIAYNVFETYRGAEAGHVYGRVLATVRHLFGADVFTIYPYQLGQDNDEALDSGAWWFYQKLGFRPREPGALRVMEAELSKMRRRGGHRSTRATLVRLADWNVYFHLGRRRWDVIGELPLSAVGLRVTDLLARRFGADRERAERDCAREAARRLGVRAPAGWSPGERRAWRRWGPLLALVPGMERWSAAERRAAVAVVRAKGGRRESDFVRAFDGHRRLREAVRRLAREP